MPIYNTCPVCGGYSPSEGFCAVCGKFAEDFMIQSESESQSPLDH